MRARLIVVPEPFEVVVSLWVVLDVFGEVPLEDEVPSFGAAVCVRLSVAAEEVSDPVVLLVGDVSETLTRLPAALGESCPVPSKKCDEGLCSVPPQEVSSIAAPSSKAQPKPPARLHGLKHIESSFLPYRLGPIEAAIFSS